MRLDRSTTVELGGCHGGWIVGGLGTPDGRALRAGS
jgi:hypothetical protein